MRRPWWLVLVLGCLIAAAPAEHSDTDDLERNRRLLEKWRADPEHYRRLQSDLRAFYALPPDRQEQIRRFDRQLHETDLTTQTRLWAVLDRYSVWLERLPEAQRQQILKTEAPADRLTLIRDLRQREWIDRLPAKLRDEVLKLPDDRRAARVAALRQEERALRLAWMAPLQQPARPSTAKVPVAKSTNPPPKPPPPTEVPAPPQPRPLRLADFPDGVQEFVEQVLRPRLTAAEKKELAQAEGRWPDLARTIRKLADKYPVLPPLPSGEITEQTGLWKRLSPAGWKVISPPKDKEKKRLKTLARLQGKWPDYALAAARMIKLHGKTATPLGASKPSEFPEKMRPAIRKLIESLSDA
jgi:hypothetical protein